MTTLEQPDWLEIGSSQYDCGTCGHSPLDWVYAYPDTNDETRWLACPNCAFEDRTLGEPTVESEWYQNRYTSSTDCTQ